MNLVNVWEFQFITKIEEQYMKIEATLTSFEIHVK